MDVFCDGQAVRRLLACWQVLGAVGRLVRIERCERVQLITCAARLVVSSCHDCIFYLGVNRAPLLTGDNRFIQVGFGDSLTRQGILSMECHDAVRKRPTEVTVLTARVSRLQCSSYLRGLILSAGCLDFNQKTSKRATLCALVTFYRA